MAPLLGDVRLIQHDHSLGIPQVFRHIGAQRIPYSVGRPDRAGRHDQLVTKVSDLHLGTVRGTGLRMVTRPEMPNDHCRIG